MNSPRFQSLQNTLRPLLRRLMRRAKGLPADQSSPDEDSAVSRRVIEQLVGQSIRDLAIYERALIHRSVLRGSSKGFLVSNERLEFLGDAVLGLIVSEYLYDHFADKDEGFLTRTRAKLVNGQALAGYARALNLGPLVLMSENMEQTDGRSNPTILADAFEAIIGALYLDLGLEAARAFILRTIQAYVDLADVAHRRDNYKSMLLEHAQAKGWPQPLYRVASEEGPSHEKEFTIEVLVNQVPYGIGTARSKKQAEQQAAAAALERLRSEEVFSAPEE